MRRRTRLRICAVLMAALFATTLVVSRGVASPDDAAAEKALRDTDNEWAKAAAANDLERTVSYYSDDATLLSPNAPPGTGKEAIRREWTAVLGGFNGTLRWHATKVEVSRSGDLGYTIGAYEGTFTPPNGKSVKDRGKYLEAWKKQADGKWKCVADMYSSDLPTSDAQ
jgi:uncharacterized protein (TIGR02246 family)